MKNQKNSEHPELYAHCSIEIGGRVDENSTMIITETQIFLVPQILIKKY